MKSPQDVEQQLERLGHDWPADASIVDRVMGQIESSGVRPRPPAGSRHRWRSALAVAAAVAVLATAWWIVAPVDNSLYARALEAIENARTIHCVSRVVPGDDKPAVVAVESWCERGVGFRVDLPHELRLGNPRHLWTYRKKDKLAIRSESRDIDKLIDRELNLKRVLDELRQYGFERYAEADETVDGRRLTAYLITNFTNAADPAVKAGEKRAVVLLDESSRIVRSRLEARRGDRWFPSLLSEWQYDVPMDRGLFEPGFGDDVKIVDVDAAFHELVNLDKAAYQDERRGIIFAIHRLERFAGDGVLVVSSVRGSPETLKKYPLTQRPVQLGLYVADGPAENLHTSPQGNNYFRIEMAQVSYQGIDVCWWVLVPRGTNAPPYEVEPGKVKLPVGYTPVGWTEYGKTFVDDKGILQHVTWDALVDLPAVKDPHDLDDIAQSVYSDMSSLGGVPFRQLYFGVKPGTNTSDRRNPDDVSATEYRAGAERNVMLWHERDLEFQLQGQFTEKSRREAASWAGTPAISVSYSPLVDDLTLAEIAKRTSIERLYLDGTRITDNGLKELAPLKNLSALSLINTPITDAGLKHLECLSTLKKLHLHGTQVTPAGIAELVTAIPGLKVTE